MGFLERRLWRPWARLLVRNPCTVVAATFTVSWLMAIIAFTAVPFEIDTSNDSFQVRDLSREREDAIRVNAEATEYRPKGDLQAKVVPQRSSPRWALSLMVADVENSDGERTDDILTNQIFAKLDRLVQIVEEHEGYREKHCVLVDMGINVSCDTSTADMRAATCKCQPPVGLLQFMPDSGRDVKAELNKLCKNNQTAKLVDSFVSREFVCSDPTKHESTVTRMTVFFGSPLEGFKNQDDRISEQETAVDEWLLAEDSDGKTLEQKLLDFRDEEKDLIDVVWLGQAITQKEFNDLIQTDGAFSVLAVLMVGLYVGFHTRSFFLTLFGMLHVLVSFAAAYFCIRIIGQVEKFSMLNTLTVFVILGIGADDIFIFLDAWKQAGQYSRDAVNGNGHKIRTLGDLERQMQFSHTRATYAMLVTSITTAFAFFSNAFSTIPPIRTFGIFTGLCVLLNYLLVITQFPSMVVLYEQIFGPYTYKELWLKCACCVGFISPEKAAVDIPLREVDDGSEEASVVEIKDLDEQNLEQFRFLEKVFFLHYSPLVNKIKVPIIVCFAILAGFAVYGATQLQPEEEPARFLPDDYPVQILLDLERDVFKRSEFVSQAQLVFGILRNDVSEVDSNDPNDRGVVVYDEKMPAAIAVYANQQKFIDACEQVRNLKSTRVSSTTGKKEVLCWMENFETWYMEKNLLNASDASVQRRPVGARFFTELEEFVITYNYEKGTTTSLWDQRPKGFENTIRFDSQRNLKFMAIIANVTLKANDPARKSEPVFDEWQALEDSLKADMPEGLNSLFQSSDRWPQLFTEKSLLGTAILGIVLSIVLSAVIISVFTRNVILTPLMIVSVVGVIVTMLGAIFALGWQLGVIESICITILTGLSIDYIVHLGIAINESGAVGRYERVRAGVTTMGISVLSASLTTIFSSVCLLFTTVLFFVRFGIFLLLTIIAASLWAFGFFIAASFLFAPDAPGKFMYCAGNRVAGTKDGEDETKPQRPRGATTSDIESGESIDRSTGSSSGRSSSGSAAFSGSQSSAQDNSHNNEASSTTAASRSRSDEGSVSSE